MASEINIQTLFSQAQEYLTHGQDKSKLYQFIAKHPKLIYYEDETNGSLLNLAVRHSYYSYDVVKELVKLGFSVNQRVIKSFFMGYFYRHNATKDVMKEFLLPFMSLEQLKRARSSLVENGQNFSFDKFYLVAFEKSIAYLDEHIRLLDEKKQLEESVKEYNDTKRLKI